MTMGIEHFIITTPSFLVIINSTMKVLYFDCFLGASGDMILSALLDLGVPLDLVQKTIEQIYPHDVKIFLKRVEKNHLSALSLEISAPPSDKSLSYREMKEIIEKADLKQKIKEDSLAILHKLASAEAFVHDINIDDVHFHELGGIDTIVDIVGTATAIDFLSVDQIYSSPLPISYGFIEIEHGILPVPAPATMKLLEGVPIRQVNVEGETLTPTGAAIITHYAKGYFLPPMRLSKIGLGAGKKDFPIPNILRVLLGESIEKLKMEDIVLLETNIDDMAPNLYEFVIDELLKAGALDVFLQPIIMKRSRPGVILSVLSKQEDVEKLCELMFRETTTIGIRLKRLERAVLEREIVKVETKWGEIEVKVAKMGDKILGFSPELRSCEEIARRQNIPLKKVIDEARKAFIEKG
jgi:uncharacterized protein (TIGR00299 family) protein